MRSRFSGGLLVRLPQRGQTRIRWRTSQAYDRERGCDHFVIVRAFLRLRFAVGRDHEGLVLPNRVRVMQNDRKLANGLIQA